MSNNTLKYKTRGSSTPNRKPKVCFFSHTNDFDKYFDMISDDILASQNCSVWYMKSISLPIDQITAFDLSQMQLFVVPVTRQFLTDNNNPATEILTYALKQNIPILPIMVEVELDYLYAEKFHNMQYLNRMDQHPAAIPYTVKLSKFLSHVLISDEEAEKIRSAFDAYIFLSYRKKDRRFAQEIMKLIHKDEYCERIAIWYDEFLIPGEDFDTSIQKALEKSSLFSMAVTPNIVHEENYVMDVEYPMAQSLNKPILPIEIVPTDRAELYAHYLDIPEPINTFDALKLYNKLHDMLHASTRPTDDAEQIFFIGLAYLSGTDVEVDREKGIKLIEKAAEADLNEAVRKLVDIYSKGNSSAQDYEKACAWEKKLIEKYADIAEKSYEYKDAVRCFKEIMNFVDLADDHRDTERVLKLCERAYNIARKLYLGGTWKMIAKRICSFLKRSDRYDYRREITYDLLKCCRLALKHYYDIDIREQVEKWLNQTDILVKVLERNFDDDLANEEFFATYYVFTEICIKNEKYDEARTYVQKMSAILDNWVDAKESIDFRIRQAAVCQKEGEIHLAVDNLAQAHICQQKSTDLLLKIASEYPEDATIALQLIEAWNRLGVICCHEQAEKNARECLNAALKIIEDFKYQGYDWKESLWYARLLMLSGDIFVLEKDNEKALEMYHIAHKIFSGISKDAVSAQIHRDISYTALQMGICYEWTDKWEEAFEWYMRSNSGYADVCALSKNIMDARRQGDVCIRLWNNAIHRDDPVLEKEWYKKSLFLYREVAKISNSECDKMKLNDLTADRKRLKESGKIRGIDPDDPSIFIQYIVNHPVKYDKSIQMYIETEIGKLVEKCLQMQGHAMKEGEYTAFTKLAVSLKNRDHENGMEGWTSIVLDYFGKHNNAFIEYDECAALIINFCGCYGINHIRYIIGGKEKYINGYFNHYCSEPFWEMPVQRIQYLDLWKAMHSWIMASKT